MSLQETTGSLNLEESINKTTQEEIFYYINFSKLSNVNDLVLVLSSMGFGISNKNPGFESIKQFLDLDKPVRMQ